MPAAIPAAYSAAYKRAVVLILMLAYTFNSAGRSVVSIISQPMKVELHLSDTQLGLLGGTAFAALYAFSGIPIARLAERLSRVNILTVALIVWSGLTALFGGATTFAQLAIMRIGVGIGEAGCSPCAHSLISDYFAPERRASALSIYSLGISIGYIFVAVVAGYVSLRYGWRIACVAVGAPGIVVALLLKLYIAEPRRGQSELNAPTAPTAPTIERPFSLAHELSELTAVARLLLGRWPMVNIVLGLVLSSFAAYGVYAFVPAFLRRAYLLDYGTIGLVSALAGGVAVGIGLLAGGFIADAVGARDARWYALVPAIGLGIAAPLFTWTFVQVDWQRAGLLLAAAGFFQYASLGPTFGVVQNVVDRRRRATATALIFILLNVIALGGGPLFTGWAIDRFAELDFHQATRAALSFASACPGGTSSSAQPAAQALCARALIHASRQGILLTVLFYAWGAVHYLLAAIGLDAEMRAARVRNATVA
ncbi:MAG TPA: MFS transporter [Steroidobacteraceae bacterium]|nr:MFS transporter [Steroidobacteraceae bacterium]